MNPIKVFCFAMLGFLVLGECVAVLASLHEAPAQTVRAIMGGFVGIVALLSAAALALSVRAAR